jgi:hypothetical protein
VNSCGRSDDDEEEIQTPTREEILSVAALIGYNMQDLIRAEEELVDMEKSSPSSAKTCCPLSA